MNYILFDGIIAFLSIYWNWLQKWLPKALFRNTIHFHTILTHSSRIVNLKKKYIYFLFWCHILDASNSMKSCQDMIRFSGRLHCSLSHVCFHKPPALHCIMRPHITFLVVCYEQGKLSCERLGPVSDHPISTQSYIFIVAYHHVTTLHHWWADKTLYHISKCQTNFRRA